MHSLDSYLHKQYPLNYIENVAIFEPFIILDSPKHCSIFIFQKICTFEFTLRILTLVTPIEMQ